MNSSKNNNLQETHPLFPSGEWEGFYIYTILSGHRGKMAFSLNFKDGIVEGSGSDNVGAFNWRGDYDKEGLRCRMTKYYASHTVFYDGHVDENGIWGTWTISEHWKGGFHIWPKGIEEEMAEVVEEAVPVEMTGGSEEIGRGWGAGGIAGEKHLQWRVKTPAMVRAVSFNY